MHRHVIAVAAAALCVQAIGCARQAEPSRSENVSGYLFVQVSESGTFEGDRLTLDGVAAQTVFFTERPQRAAGHLPTAQFVEHWNQGANSFKAVPPNASLAFVADGIESAVAIELQDLVLEGARMSFRVRVLNGAVPAAFADASLFIDAGGLMQLVAYGAQDVYGR